MKKIVVAILIIALIMRLLPLFSYAKTTELEEDMDYKMPYICVVGYFFRCRIAIEAVNTEKTITARVKVLQNYNTKSGDYPTDKITFNRFYTEYIEKTGIVFEEYIIKTTQFENADGNYDVDLMIGIKEGKLFIVEGNDKYAEFLFDGVEPSKTLAELEVYYAEIVSEYEVYDAWIKEKTSDAKKRYNIAVSKYYLAIFTIIVGGITFTTAAGLGFTKLINNIGKRSKNE